ncbi:MAG: hypothetical protein HQ472_09295 [Ignavibacteria bacterium]|nr:hypothetical protein [Ignavibacteria bacterium]
MKLREYALGEDRILLFDPRALAVVACVMVVAVISCMLFLQIDKPAVFHYAFPLVIASQAVQMGLRVMFQRTRIKTDAVMVRSVLSERVYIAPYKNLVAVVIGDQNLWLRVSLLLPSEEITFRIFRSSKKNLIHILEASCSVPVMISKQNQPNEGSRKTDKKIDEKND